MSHARTWTRRCTHWIDLYIQWIDRSRHWIDLCMMFSRVFRQGVPRSGNSRLQKRDNRRRMAASGPNQFLIAGQSERKQPGGLAEGSRGLSASDTPGQRRRRFAPRPGCRKLSLPRPLRGRVVWRTLTGGVVAALLNPRLPSGIAPRCAATSSMDD
jgi:hypothetical protein